MSFDGNTARSGGENYYEILGLAPGASEDEIEAAYADLSLMFAADRVPPSRQDYARKQRRRLAAAYSVLADPEQRAAYDSNFRTGTPSPEAVSDMATLPPLMEATPPAVPEPEVWPVTPAPEPEAPSAPPEYEPESPTIEPAPEPETPPTPPEYEPYGPPAMPGAPEPEVWPVTPAPEPEAPSTRSEYEPESPAITPGPEAPSAPSEYEPEAPSAPPAVPEPEVWLVTPAPATGPEVPLEPATASVASAEETGAATAASAVEVGGYGDIAEVEEPEEAEEENSESEAEEPDASDEEDYEAEAEEPGEDEEAEEAEADEEWEVEENEYTAAPPSRGIAASAPAARPAQASSVRVAPARAATVRGQRPATQAAQGGVMLPNRREAAQIVARKPEPVEQPAAERYARPRARRAPEYYDEIPPSRAMRQPPPRKRKRKSNNLLAYQIMTLVIAVVLVLGTVAGFFSTTSLTPTTTGVTPGLANAVAGSPTTSSAQLLNAAKAQVAQGQYNVAEAMYQGVLSTDPNNLDATLGLAQAYMSQQPPDPQKASLFANRVIQISPSSLQAAGARIVLAAVGTPGTAAPAGTAAPPDASRPAAPAPTSTSKR